ncbi:acyl-coenzyme A thioesterase 4, mitochondrial [Humulus lupulus]|uniref:Acyl-coenzyme A thioesterase 4, mitochondrial n=1 Tax=Humulus lupulus TaxID=3486 RepID=TE4_HUMLU|nr:acyl-coenzyme A thioesterase 4, mitochondrial [Humulus lupulus]S4TF94.1 RecName: Full=Acyl-coenzyme A thioesterase 4, mitochondrial; Short=Acyl-CoA thioesterase 4; Short=HlTE4; AltName: Full=2-methylbutanoyl-CoA hydrolase TE4; AltName: Full=2-methylpropanoyl-CoA hydrolase TE4; AltName: Full=3-methylbutanoyl-CoA hydrolase TE4; AltName: Full=Acyl-CoA thioester hydrolase 4; AltName: Full=Butanoyl-CoA hydrolase TE4; AltName: Full=Propanoyl-CoA hydrolase TE4; Flags: Precursor [Humulus lupulus]AGA17
MMTPIGIRIRKQIPLSYHYSSIQALLSRFTPTPYNPISNSSSSTQTIPTQFHESQCTNPISRPTVFLFDPPPIRFTHTKSFSTDPSSLDFPSNQPPVVSTISSHHNISQPIDAGSSIRKPISLWPGMFNSPVTNALWEARSNMFEKYGEPTADPPSQSELVTKSPAQSRTSILYNLSSDYALREHYRNPWNMIRIGKLLEDLDALAGTIAFKHCTNEDGMSRPLLLVTASVDKMVLKKPISIDTDLSIVGAVTWVGRSSMEIQLQVLQTTHESSDPSDSVSLVANFTFVARDSKTGKSAVINQISPETGEEKLLWREADERNKMRKMKRKIQKDLELEKQYIERLNALLAEGRVFCDLPALADRNSILMKDTCLENSFICQPQQRNIYGRIFGGFLMRRAVELAFSTTYSFAGVVTHFLEVDHVDFLRPVDVGDFLRLKSCVLYTELQNPTEPLINVEVVAHVTRPELRSSEVSNKFYFTFSVGPEAVKDGLLVRNVVPATEEEARRVLERMDAETPHPHSQYENEI